MTEQEQATTEWRAPYVGYSTLKTFIDKKCAENPIPPQIDKTFIDNVAGGVQPLLLGALKTIGFISDDQTTQPKLEEAATAPERRQALLKEWATEYYSAQLALAAQNATSQMLFDSFSPANYTGSTLRKAIAFYLNLCDDVGLPKSPHFKLPKQTTSTRRKKTGPASDGDPKPPRLEPLPLNLPPGEKTTVDLGAAGTVTLFVDVRWLALDDDVFMKLRAGIRGLQDLAVRDDEEDDVIDEIDQGDEEAS
ncbi:MAG TPA: hypothetical protein VF228_16025 [Iamia sp.]